jgi:hypothetical protein
VTKPEAVALATSTNKYTTQTVFGEGRARAMLMLMGGQPGDAEDLSGHPFVGPAGKLLDRANRIHKKPRASETGACRPWHPAMANYDSAAPSTRTVCTSAGVYVHCEEISVRILHTGTDFADGPGKLLAPPFSVTLGTEISFLSASVKRSSLTHSVMFLCHRSAPLFLLLWRAFS